ncbi:MAG: hypothetical protein ACFFBV_05035 [Promethearchaeota archaeon]
MIFSFSFPLEQILRYILESPFILANIIIFSTIFIISFILIYFTLIKKRISFRFKNDKTFIRFVLSICIAISLLLNFYYISFTSDDAFISFRYATNLVDGYGLVFNSNTNNPVEGYSNFLWVLINAIPILLNLDIVIWFKVLSIIINIGSILVIYKLGTLFYSNKIALFCPMLYSIYYPIQLWIVGGLEIPILILSLIAAFYFLFKEVSKESKFPILSSLFFLIHALTRIDGIIFFIGVEFSVIIYYLFINKKKNIVYQRIFSLLFVGTPYTIYFLWRFLYYGQFFPNSYYAKASKSFVLITTSGIQYLLLFLVFTAPIVILMIFAVIKILLNKEKEMIKMVLPAIIPILINFAVILNIEKHYAGQGFRFALISVPFMILIGCYSFKVLNDYKTTKFKLNYRQFKISLNKLIPLLCSFGLIIYPFTAPIVYINTSSTDVADKYHKLAFWFKDNVDNNVSIAFTDMGVIPYYSELEFIDLWGICDETIARDRSAADYVLGKKPEFIFIKENNLGEIKAIRDHVDFQSNYTRFFTIELREITQYLKEAIYDLNIYKHNDYLLSNATLVSLFS